MSNVHDHKNVENVIRYFLLYLPPKGRKNILDIGAGTSCPYRGVLSTRCGEYRALDVRGAFPKVDFVMDLTEGTPFEDNQWEWGWCSEVVEHIEPDKKKMFVDEALRICENIVFTFPTPKLEEVFYDDPGHTEVKIDFEKEYSHSHQITDKTTENGRAIFIMNKLFDGKVIQRPEFVGSTINQFFDNE